MANKRSRNPTMPIHITLPIAVIKQIDSRLEYKQSRSGWILDACRSKFGGARTVTDSTSTQLLAALFTRGAITKAQFDLLSSSLDHDANL